MTFFWRLVDAIAGIRFCGRFNFSHPVSVCPKWVETGAVRIVAEGQGRYATIRRSPEWRNRQTQGT